ncbi:helicase associated domain-containing protein [Streptomyces thermoviolaceus]|uniref:helicase associated domain-containing protein n=1 Tax=Streptomyces TaxID=1883 RepID=UPI00163D3B0C|nr:MULTISPECIES: helicase associated domain-containing protein [Streptomyces]MCM3264971.1 helicase associated domain-containing protein [Streptomyces thermoviolaceus]WTD46058.1 helicase associated domain-containing protein [Streptomyces thermoviolaceus]WTD50760.1 helicase associated domain-containing protein [Streptomyces thermoviolaceus]GGV76676.1 hypothetical protein GCM10010499_34840 [Streptomyces thermoviolaceus subsp. apingens]GHA74187.1 hypothetical protein GCM10010512_00370 [Streptomyce
MSDAVAQQYDEREGHLRVPRKHIDRIVVGNSEEREIRLGAWISNRRSRAVALAPERINDFPPSARTGHTTGTPTTCSTAPRRPPETRTP